MAGLVPNRGEAVALANWLNKTLPQNQILKLFKNNIIPDENTVEGDFVEATFPGYIAKSLIGGSWTITEGNPSFAVYALQTFTASANGVTQLIYGYYVVQSASGKLMFCERALTPQAVQFTGDFIEVTPKTTAD